MTPKVIRNGTRSRPHALDLGDAQRPVNAGGGGEGERVVGSGGGAAVSCHAPCHASCHALCHAPR